MTCERFVAALDALDNEPLPEDLEAHARTCQSCAREAAALRAALGLYRLADVAGSADLVPKVMALLPFVPAPRRVVAMRDWLVAGLVILGSIVLVPLLADFKALKAVYGAAFTLPVSLALGLIITLYAGLFVMSHLDDFGRRLKDFEALRHGRPA